jgi:hypothetical protein
MARLAVPGLRFAIALALFTSGGVAVAGEGAEAPATPAAPAATAEAPPPASAGAPPATPAAAPPAAPPVRPFQLVAWTGLDFGFTTLVEVTYEDGSHQKLTANEGFMLAAGASFLRFLEGRLETQATIGYKRASLSATNGSITFSAWPIEVLEAWQAGPVRLAAGLSLQLSPRVDGSGVASALDVGFDPSLGVVLQAAWTWRPGAEQRWRLELGGRFTWQTLRVSSGQQVTTDANALGIVFGAAY